MSKSVLIETSLFQPISSLVENRGTNGNMVVEGILTTVNQENGNSRVYPKSLWEREMNKYSQLIKENRALGELDHPESSVINLKNSSHNIKELYWEGNDLMGKIEVLTTPSGNILKELFKNDITVGISSRGMGSVSQLGEGRVEVEDDFELLCWDFVSTPSTHGAFMKPTGLNEGKVHRTINKYTKLNEIISDIICTQSGICCFR